MTRVVVEVQDMHAATVEASAGLWAYLTGIDLVGEIRAPRRPLDEPVDLMLVNPWKCWTTGIDDELWLRLVDVPAALAARTYGAADPVVIDVADRFLPDNSGRYLIEQGGVERTDRPAHLDMDVDALGMLYLGQFPASALAAVGG